MASVQAVQVGTIAAPTTSAEPDSAAVFLGAAPVKEAAAEFGEWVATAVSSGEGASYFGDRFDACVDVLIAGLRTVVT